MPDFREMLSKPIGDTKTPPPPIPAGVWKLQIVGSPQIVEPTAQKNGVVIFKLRTLEPIKINDDAGLEKFREFYEGHDDRATYDLRFFLTDKAFYRLSAFLADVLGIDDKTPPAQAFDMAANMTFQGEFKNTPRSDGTGFYSNLDSADCAAIG